MASDPDFRREDCAHCGAWLDGRQTLWCSAACRVRAYRQRKREAAREARGTVTSGH